LDLRAKPNDELFQLWKGELAFHYRSERSLHEARRVIGGFERFLDGRRPSADLAKAYLSRFLSRKPNTLARYATHIGQFMKWYGEPLDFQIKQPKMLPQITDPEGVAGVLAAMASRKTHKSKVQRDILLVETARLTGLRRSELANLKVGDLDFINQVVVVRSGKGLKDRSVPLVSSLSTRLEGFCHGREPGESLFGLEAVTISGKISYWAKKAGYPNIHAHSLRHQFGTELARRGAGARTIQSLLGHSDLATTQRYLDVVGKDLRDAVNLLDETAPPVEEATGVIETPENPPGEEDVPADEGHDRQVQALAQRLRAEMTVPSSWEVFSLPSQGQNRSTDNLSWSMLDDAAAIELSLHIEEDREATYLLHSLFSHLATSGFAGIPGEIGDWKERLAHYLAGCYRLLANVRSDIKEMTGAKVPPGFRSRSGITVWFPLTICMGSVERGSSFEALEYVQETVQGGLHGLKFAGYIIAAASSEDERDCYEETHIKLRDRYVGSPEAGEIAGFFNELQDLGRQISSELQKFGLIVRLPGHCALCRP
jgi:integrase